MKVRLRGVSPRRFSASLFGNSYVSHTVCTTSSLGQLNDTKWKLEKNLNSTVMESKTCWSSRHDCFSLHAKYLHYDCYTSCFPLLTSVEIIRAKTKLPRRHAATVLEKEENAKSMTTQMLPSVCLQSVIILAVFSSCYQPLGKNVTSEC